MSITREATVTSKGQVTIPKEIRDELGIAEGSELEFVLESSGQIAVRPKKPAMERLRAVRDTLSKHDVDLDEMRRDSKAAWSGHGNGEHEA